MISGGSSTTHVDPDRLCYIPDLNAGSGASKRSQAALVVEVLDECGGGGGGGGGGVVNGFIINVCILVYYFQ